MIQEYSLGFLFDKTFDHIVLIRKNRPIWQVGKLNGIGGKVEEHESPYACMYREFAEETGRRIPQWQHVCTLEGIAAKSSDDCSDGYAVHVFAATDDGLGVMSCQSMTDEEVRLFDTDAIINDYSDCVPNLAWLIPMCTQKLKGVYGETVFTVTEC